METKEKKIIPIRAVRPLDDYPMGIDDLLWIIEKNHGEESEYFRARKALEEVTEFAQAMHHLNVCPHVMETTTERLQYDADYELSDAVATILYCVKVRADKAGMQFVDALNLLVKMAYDKISGRQVDPEYLR